MYAKRRTGSGSEEEQRARGANLRRVGRRRGFGALIGGGRLLLMRMVLAFARARATALVLVLLGGGRRLRLRLRHRLLARRLLRALLDLCETRATARVVVAAPSASQSRIPEPDAIQLTMAQCQMQGTYRTCRRLKLWLEI